MSSPRLSQKKTDVAAVLALLVASVAMSWTMFRGGYLTGLDNPAHLAEVYALANEAHRGWSDIAFCGFPIGSLHSPLWYGALGFFARLGVNVPAIYAFCVWLGLVAPVMAVYCVARRRVSSVWAAFLSFLLLVQKPALVGIGSALGGMWTFYIAAGAVVLLLDRFSRADDALPNLVSIAALVGFTLLSHLYALVPVGLLSGIFVWLSVERGRGLRFVARHVAALAVGVLAASWYWMPLVLAGGSTVIRPQNLDTGMVAARLFLSTDLMDLLNGSLPPFDVRTVVESIPIAGLLLLGVAGASRIPRRRDDMPVYGFLLFVATAILVGVIAAEFNVRFLGPGSWRMLYFARLGCVVAAIPLLAELASRKRALWLAAPTGVVVAAAFVVAGAARATTPPISGPRVAEVRELWAWLADNHDETWGRVYLQDTFDRGTDGLSRSHVLALTAHETGVHQLGATYGVAPYRTADWTPSEFGMLFRKFVTRDDHVQYVRDMMWRTHSTHIVVHDPRARDHLEADPSFERLTVIGRYHVLHSLEDDDWIAALTPGADAVVDSFGTGRIVLHTTTENAGGAFLVKSAFYPGWWVSGPTGARLGADESGLMTLTSVEPGAFTIELEFRPARWPRWLALACWVWIGGAWVVSRWRTRALSDMAI